MRIDAVKIGMLGAQDVMAAVAQALRAHQAPKVVLDTVMVAKSGDRLMPDDAVAFFKEELLPLADVITPNLPEASVLLGREVRATANMHEAARELWDMCGGKTAVYLKGGHSVEETLRDVFYDGKAFIDLDGPRVHTKTRMAQDAHFRRPLPRSGRAPTICRRRFVWLGATLKKPSTLPTI